MRCSRNRACQMNRDENAAINICREGLRISGVELETERKIS